MKVAIRVDASFEHGFGHFYRCLSLAQELQKRSYEAVFVTKIYPETAEAFMSCGFDVVPLKPKSSLQEDMEAVASTGADAFVIDILDTSQEYMKYLKSRCSFLLSIDDNGPGAHVADKVINILYNRISGPNIIFDLSYAMLRDQFLRARRQRTINENVKKVLVMQGAADTRGIMSYAIEKMERGDYVADLSVMAGRMVGHASVPMEGGDYEVTVVAGQAFRVIPEQKRGVKIVRNVEDIQNLMADADIAITAAGMSLLELLCLGTPTITVCAERFENETAQHIEALGATTNLGFGPEIQPHTIRSAVETLARNAEKRRQMSARGMELVDGKGTQRVADIIESGIKAFRK